MFVNISQEDEQRLRQLAAGLAQGIRDPAEILQELGFSEDDWRQLEKSRAFKRIVSEAQAEWNSASRTAQRVKLKAAVNIEQALPQFYEDMHDSTQPLASRVRLLEALTHLAGLPEQEARGAGLGAQFKLEIHLGGDRVDVVQVGTTGGMLPWRNAIVDLEADKPESFKLPPDVITPEE